MKARVFFDTNVLVYAAMGSGAYEDKRKRALRLIETEEFGTSAQVLQEFFVTVVKKASLPLSPAQALEWIEQWVQFLARRSTTTWCGLPSNFPSGTPSLIGTLRFWRRPRPWARIPSTPKT